jgi:hypothetical protein
MPVWGRVRGTAVPPPSRQHGEAGDAVNGYRERADQDPEAAVVAALLGQRGDPNSGHSAQVATGVIVDPLDGSAIPTVLEGGEPGVESARDWRDGRWPAP